MPMYRAYRTAFIFHVVVRYPVQQRFFSQNSSTRHTVLIFPPARPRSHAAEAVFDENGPEGVRIRRRGGLGPGAGGVRGQDHGGPREQVAEHNGRAGVHHQAAAGRRRGDRGPGAGVRLGEHDEQRPGDGPQVLDGRETARERGDGQPGPGGLPAARGPGTVGGQDTVAPQASGRGRLNGLRWRGGV